MGQTSVFHRIIANLGYRNESEFFIKYVLPLTAVVLFIFFITLFVFTNLPIILPYIILLAGMGFVALYPYIKFEKNKNSVNENLHLFITYAGTISTMDINRHLLFQKVAEKKTLGEIANTAEKIEYLARKWNLGFARTCRSIAKLTPSKIMSDFLDRLAVMFDFGESLTTFLNDEQSAIMDDFSANYKQSLENIKTLQDIFLSLTMALGFLISIGLILPLIGSISMEVVVRYALMIIFVMDVLVLLFVYNFIPADHLLQQSDILDSGKKQIYTWVYICFPISFILLIFLFVVDFFPFLINVGVGVAPLFGVGLIAQKVENDVFTKDKAFPAYARSLGSAIEIKGGAAMSALRSLQVHDFGPLNTLSTDLYRRLRTGNDKRVAWKFFSAESGSNLIYQFSQILSEGIFLGGAPEKIGEIVSENFQRLISLRKLKLQLSSGLRGALYGSLIGFSAAAYVSAQIANLLGELFSIPFDDIDTGSNPLGGVVSGLSPSDGLGVDMQTITLYIGLMIIVHAVVSGIIIKIVDGGSIYSAFFDIVIMIWMGAALSIFLPWAIGFFLPGIDDLTGTATETATGALTAGGSAMMLLLTKTRRRNYARDTDPPQKAYRTMITAVSSFAQTQTPRVVSNTYGRLHMYSMTSSHLYKPALEPILAMLRIRSTTK